MPGFEISTVDVSLARLKETGKRVLSGSVSFGFLSNPGTISFRFVERNQYLENFEEMLKLSFFNYQQLRLDDEAEFKDLKNKYKINISHLGSPEYDLFKEEDYLWLASIMI